jgi:hypothetical protein
LRYDRGVLESFVDLTYRGLSLGRRIRLTQIRPSSGYLEIAAPMPVGAQIAVIADDGAVFDAIVTGIHEQVSGSDRVPGMTVTPALGDAAAAAWWTSRVQLADDDALRPRRATGGRTRPTTVRPRTRTAPTSPPGGVTLEVPTIIADLEARVTAAAGLAPRHDDPHEARTVVMPVHEIEAIAAQARTDSVPPPMRRTGEHEVVDDGNHTTIMETIDPALLGLDLTALTATHAPAPASTGEPPTQSDAAPAPDAGDDDAAGDDGDAGDDGSDGNDADVTVAGKPGDTLEDPPPAPRPGRRKRRLRR